MTEEFDQYKLPHRFTRDGYMWMLAGLLPKGFIWFGRRLTLGRIVQDISAGDTGWQDGEAYSSEIQDVSEVSGAGDLLLRLLACFGAELERLGDDAYQLLNESDPGSAVWLLSDWERVLGLPETEIAGLSFTLEERQRQAHVKRFHAEEMTTAAWYVAYAATLGFGITVEELPIWSNARIYGAAQYGLEPYGGTRGYSELRITINSADSAIDLLKAMLNRRKQAHVTIEYIDATRASFTWSGTGAKLLQLGGETGRTVSVDWGDGSDVDTYTLSSVSLINCTHTYSAGPNTVVISGWVYKITDLILDSQIVTNIDGLTHLTGLVTFYMYDNSVADISVLDKLVNLEFLDIGINNFTDISSLSGLTKLRELYLGPNTIGDISHLSTLVNLEVLFVIQCGVASLSFASGMTYLTDLDASNNSITSISVLTSLPLVNVDISHNLITDVSPLKDIPTLEVCVFNSNELTYTTVDWPTYDGVTLTGYSTSLTPPEVDLFLNDLYSDLVVNSAINLAGTNGPRTVASDTAVTWLRANGNTITVNE